VIELVGATPNGYHSPVPKWFGEIGLATDLNWTKILGDADDDLPEVRTILRDQPFFAVCFFVYRCFNLFCRAFMRLEV
jgi:hypothetical protein